MADQRDGLGRRVYYFSNTGPEVIYYESGMGPIAMVQNLFAQGHTSWTGNEVGRAGYDWGNRLFDLVHHHTGVNPVPNSGESIEALLERYNVPQEEAAAFLAELHAAAGK